MTHKFTVPMLAICLAVMLNFSAATDISDIKGVWFMT